MTEEEKTPDFAALMAELGSALDAHKEAEREENYARLKTTDARNRLNRAQKALDEALSNLRKDAPWGTDWRNTLHHMEEVPK